MLSDEQLQKVSEKLRLFRLVPLCMILFVVGFAVFVSQISGKAISTGPPKMLTMFGFFAALTMFTMACIIPRVFSGRPKSKQNSDEEHAVVSSAFNTFAVETMIRYALILAAAFVNLLVFIVDPHVGSLVAAGLGAVLMILFFPRNSKAISVIERQTKPS